MIGCPKCAKLEKEFNCAYNAVYLSSEYKEAKEEYEKAKKKFYKAECVFNNKVCKLEMHYGKTKAWNKLIDEHNSHVK